MPYYFNAALKTSSWEPPENLNAPVFKAYMEKYHPTDGSGGAAAAANSDSPDKVRASHLLIKHKDSRRPSSWKEANITRTKEEALKLLQGHESRIKSGAATLGELAVTESDCSSARKSGDLGYFKKGDMQKEFEVTAFALKPGEVSGVIETASGLHLIERTG